MTDSDVSSHQPDYNAMVSRVLDIEDVTWGDAAPSGSYPGPENYVVRFRGQLKMDAGEAYRELSRDLRPHRLSAIFRPEEDRQTILLVEDPYSPLVAPVLRIEEIAWGMPEELERSRRYQDQIVVRFLGTLMEEAESAYERVASATRSLNLTPIFLKNKGLHEVRLVKGRFDPRPSNPWINLILFLITLGSVMLAGTLNSYEGPLGENAGELIGNLIANLDEGLPFAVSLLAILLAHEFGHYLAGRYHRTAVTLPYFLPFPLSPFGTLGAFIQLKEPPRNKRVLLDIGVSGPLAGLVVAVGVLFLGLSLSEVDAIPARFPAGQGLMLEGNSLLYLAAKYLVFGELLPAPASYEGMAPFLYWIRFFFTGRPLPLGGTDVLIHPVAWAGWAGLLVTALNLIPAGQLDGGHLIYTLLGRRARAFIPIVLVALVLLGFVWSGWWLWAALIYFLGRTHAEPLDQITELNPWRRAIAVLGFAIFILVFIPVPLQTITGSGGF